MVLGVPLEDKEGPFGRRDFFEEQGGGVGGRLGAAEILEGFLTDASPVSLEIDMFREQREGQDGRGLGFRDRRLDEVAEGAKDLVLVGPIVAGREGRVTSAVDFPEMRSEDQENEEGEEDNLGNGRAAGRFCHT